MGPQSRIMRRCFELARLGAGTTSPNPMVGAVLVHAGRIIGEGYHRRYGSAHAEVMAIGSVRPEDQPLIKTSTLYVSLEPCNIHGNTPPCTDLIIEQQIPHVVVSASDLTPGVNGSGLQRLRELGVRVDEGILLADGQWLARPRNVFVHEQRPFVILKYAQSQDGFLAPAQGQQWLTNSYSKRLVHRWRTQTDAILVGKRTALVDNPALSNRLYPGPQPLRLVIDRKGNLPSYLQLFDQQHETWVFSSKPKIDKPKLKYIQHDFEEPAWLDRLLQKLQEQRLSHLTVEGGAWLLQQFINQESWDEARIFTSTVSLGDGLKAPIISGHEAKDISLVEDKLSVIQARR